MSQRGEPWVGWQTVRAHPYQSALCLGLLLLVLYSVAAGIFGLYRNASVGSVSSPASSTSSGGWATTEAPPVTPPRAADRPPQAEPSASEPAPSGSRWLGGGSGWTITETTPEARSPASSTSSGGWATTEAPAVVGTLLDKLLSLLSVLFQPPLLWFVLAFLGLLALLAGLSVLAWVWTLLRLPFLLADYLEAGTSYYKERAQHHQLRAAKRGE